MPYARALALLATLALAACPGDDGSPSDPASTSTGSTTDAPTSVDPPDDGTTSPPDDSTDGDPTTSDPDGSDGSTGQPPAEPEVHWVGRWDHVDASTHRGGWSGLGFVVRFDGTGASVTMDDASQYFTVVVDGVVQPPLATSAGMQSYALATGLPAGEHVVEAYRRTEGSFGPTVVQSVDLEGELLAPPPVTRRMEVVGDSITAGYGNEGVDPCNFSAQTENHYLTYGPIAARTVGAEIHTVAWSGKGVIYNYGDDVNEPLPEVYDRVVATEGAAWGFGWQPDVVVVNLGTNDFSTDNDPSQELFTGAYLDFVTHLRDVYPDAFILLVAPTLFGADATTADTYIAQVVAQREAEGDLQIAYANINVEWIGSGCNGHPTVATHEGMAARLVEELGVHLGW